MFSNAKTLKTATPKKKAEKAEVEIQGLENIAAIDSLIKSLTAMKALFEADAKEEIVEYFVAKGLEIKRKPDNFKGIDGEASASCELRKRGTNSPLSAEEAELLVKYDIVPDTIETVAETFVVNPAYKDDAALLGKIEKALKGVKGIPEDFIMKQEGVSKKVVPATALDELFTRDKITINALIGVLTVTAIKPTLENVEPDYARKVVARLLDEKAEEV